MEMESLAVYKVHSVRPNLQCAQCIFAMHTHTHPHPHPHPHPEAVDQCASERPASEASVPVNGLLARPRELLDTWFR